MTNTPTSSGSRPSEGAPALATAQNEIGVPSQAPPVLALNRVAPLRFSPPRSAIRVPVTDVKDGDWARSMGYWWKVRRVRPGDIEGMRRCDLESPRGTHYSVYLAHLMEARCG
jgi:hypothetical protein